MDVPPEASPQHDLPPVDSLFAEHPYVVFCPVCDRTAGNIKGTDRWFCRSERHGFYELKPSEVRPLNPSTRAEVELS